MIAYIDPGAGSFLLQAIVATLAGVALAWKTGWRKLRERLRPGGSGRDEDRGAPRDDG